MVELLTIVSLTLTQFLKKKIYPLYGEFGIHAAVFLIALLGASVWMTAQGNETLMGVLQNAWKILLMAVGFYEIIAKRLLFKSTDEIMHDTR